MIYKILITLVIFTHFLFIIYVLIGALLGLKWPKSLFMHLPAFLWGVFIELFGGICPLTPLENWLRLKIDATTYTGDFIIHYLEKVIYPPMLTREIQILFGIIVIVLNFIIYAFVYKKNSK